MLEDLVGARLAPIPGHFTEPVLVEAAEELVADVWQLTVRTLSGQLLEPMLSTAELQAAIEAGGTDSGFLEDAEGHFLLTEARRIRLAYAHDPFFAVSMSGIAPYPHQLDAVYGAMLPQPRLRFLLADDPGAGKTIMAGLLLKELELRGVLDRVLILAPAPLALQWQDELQEKFDSRFTIIKGELARASQERVWTDHNRCIASLDWAKRDEVLDELLHERWDLVIIDEAHKASMAQEDRPTGRYKLARALADRTERLLLLTATPHQGNRTQFRVLLSLLDPDVFRDDKTAERMVQVADNPWILRRVKEELRDLAGRPLFLPRQTYTESIRLSEEEFALYQAVTQYIVRFFAQRTGKRRQSAALTRTVFQRRLASSLRAIRTSLERRYERLSLLVDELKDLSPAERKQRLAEMEGVSLDPELSPEDVEDGETGGEDLVLAERFEELVEEVEALEPLVRQAKQAEHRGDEAKLTRLIQCLGRAELADVERGADKLLIFTESRDTLDYLRENVTRLGYSCTWIHGGLKMEERKQARLDFMNDKQICLATDAAGEGINLQFCHLMINYDVPWNPTRLEQRMGRIHRIGQDKEVHVFNFVADSGPDDEPVIEGRVMTVLLDKLKHIRNAMGSDRVYDVLGTLLRLQDLDLERVMADASLHPKLAQDLIDEIEEWSPEEVQKRLKTTEVSLARRTLDLTSLQGRQLDHEDRKLMPDDVASWFGRAAERVGLKLQPRRDPRILRVQHVPQKLREPGLSTHDGQRRPGREYPKLTFHKDLLVKRDADGELLSPIHALYGAVEDRLVVDHQHLAGGTSVWHDPFDPAPYRVHFFELQVLGQQLDVPGRPPRSVLAHAELVAVREGLDSSLERVPSNILHDLTPANGVPKELPPAWSKPPTVADAVKAAERFVRAKVQFPRLAELRTERERDVSIRRGFLEQAMAESIRAAKVEAMRLAGQVRAGDDASRLARDNAMNRVDVFKHRRAFRMDSLQHLAVVSPGPVAWRGSALVAPAAWAGQPSGMPPASEAVEHFAYDFTIAHEAAEGRTQVERVYELNDGCGYDLRSSRVAGGQITDVRRIEVKGLSAHEGGVHLTPNEWRKAASFGDKYWLYVVWGCLSDRPRLKIFQDPAHTLSATEVQGVVHFQIDGEVLAQGDGTEWTG